MNGLSVVAMLGSYVAAQSLSGRSDGAATLSASLELSVDDLWNIAVGPVKRANITTVVEAEPIPASDLVPPPFLETYSFPTGRQVPEVAANGSSWCFPKDFILGVAGAAFQIEGAAKDDGRGPSVWDKLVRVPGFSSDNETGDVTDNHYYLYKQDIARLAAMGINTYSFSISWSRIYPFGSGPINQAGIDFYNNLINTCLEYNITPVATLYHWDTPLFLQDKYGGWLSEDIVADFVEYARTCFLAFGDRVSMWFTVNEPIVFCNLLPLPAYYFKNVSIPAKQQPFHCGRNVVLAHAGAYRLGKSMLGDHSLITYKNNGGFKIPRTDSAEDAEAVQRAWDFNEGWFSDPIFLTGTWPSRLNDYVSTFLEPFTDAQRATIKGSSDFYAHDAYTNQFYFAPATGIAACVADERHPLFPSCVNTSYTYADGGWLVGPAADPGAPWLHKATDWVPALLRHIRATWAPPGGRILISEFGFAEPFEAYKKLAPDVLTDPLRTAYFKDYMEALLMALSEGINVMGTLAWSFVDNLEWSNGLQIRFGIQRVDFASPGLERSYKASFFQYVDVYNKYVEK